MAVCFGRFRRAAEMAVGGVQQLKLGGRVDVDPLRGGRDGRRAWAGRGRPFPVDFSSAARTRDERFLLVVVCKAVDFLDFVSCGGSGCSDGGSGCVRGRGCDGGARKALVLVVVMVGLRVVYEKSRDRDPRSRVELVKLARHRYSSPRPPAIARVL